MAGTVGTKKKMVKKRTVQARTEVLGQQNPQEKISLGARYNNPLNITESPAQRAKNDPWQGTVGYYGDDVHRFPKFDTLENGYRAGYKNAVNHFVANPDQSLGGFINIFANTSKASERAKYVQFVSDLLKVSPETLLRNLDPYEVTEAQVPMETKARAISPEVRQRLQAMFADRLYKER